MLSPTLSPTPLTDLLPGPLVVSLLAIQLPLIVTIPIVFGKPLL